MSTVVLVFILILSIAAIFLLFSKGEKKDPDSIDTSIDLGPREKSSAAKSAKSSEASTIKKRVDNFIKKTRSSVAPSLTVHQLPPPPARFFGKKEELTEIVALLKGKVHLFGLYGRSGIGKTSFIFLLANRLLSNFRDAQFYIDMKSGQENPLSIRDVMVRVIRSFHPTQMMPSDREGLSNIYQSVFKNKDAILILDNAVDSEELVQLIPKNIRLTVVITEKPCSLPDISSVKLEPLESEDSSEFLTETCPRIGSWCSEIIKLCNNLPLAVSLASHFLNANQELDPSIYLEKLREEIKRSKLGDKRGLDTSMKATFGITYLVLSQKTASALRKLTHFPHSFTAVAEEFVCEDDNNTYIGELMMYGLVQFDSFNNRYILHDQFRKYLKIRVVQSEITLAAKRHTSYYLAILATINENFLKGGGDRERAFDSFDLEWENIRAAQAWSEANRETNEEADQWCSAYTELSAPLIIHRLPADECLHWFKIGLESSRRLQDREAEKVHLLNLGSQYNALNQYEQAIEYLNESLAIAGEQKDEAGERSVLGQLGTTCLTMGKPHQAIEYFEKELALIQESEDRRGEEITLEHLGRIYLQVREYATALEYTKSGLASAREKEDPEILGRLLDDLGKIHIAREEFSAAIECLEEGLVLARENGNRNCQKDLLQSLGDAQLELGEPDNSIPLYEEALALSRETGDRTGEGTLLVRLADVYSATKKSQQAVNHYKKALPVFKTCGKRVLEAETLWKTAQELDRCGDPAQAVKSAKSALKIFADLRHPERKKVAAQLEIWEEAALNVESTEPQ